MNVEQHKLSLRERFWWFRRTTVPRFFRESVPRGIARAVPNRVIYWILIDVWAKATPRDMHPNKIRIVDAIKFFE